jgi:uncharacterized protein
LQSLSRLVQSLAQGASDADVQWQAQAELRPVTGGEPELWLSLNADVRVTLECQRCLGPMTQRLAIDRRLRFVRSEEEAERLDDESEDDVLALPPRLDLIELLEDELILALPLVPRHEGACPEPLVLAEPPPPAAEHPFAALAALRKGGP